MKYSKNHQERESEKYLLIASQYQGNNKGAFAPFFINYPS